MVTKVKILNPVQKKFLVYIQKHHKGIGWPLSIHQIIKRGEYGYYPINDILKIYKKMVMGNVAYIKNFGTPKKYRKT